MDAHTQEPAAHGEAHSHNLNIGGTASYRLRGEVLQTLHFSGELPEFTGYAQDEYAALAQQNALDLVFDEDRARLMRFLRRSCETQKTINTVVRVLHKKQGILWVHVCAQIEKEEQGTHLIHALFLKTAAETMLYYDIATRATNGCYMVSSEDHRLLFMNHSMEQLMEKQGVREYLGKKCYEAIQNRTSPCPNCTLCTQMPVEMHGDRSGRTYRVSSHDVLWNGLRARVVYLNDITEEKETASEITRIYNNIPGAAFQCRFDADWTVLSANNGLYAFLGYTREEFAALGNRMSAVIYPADLAVMQDKISVQLKNGNTSVENENRLVCKDGSIRWISIKAQLLEGTDGQQYFYCVFVDISKQKAEEQRANDTRKNLSIAMEHAKMIYWEYDFDSSTAYVNEATQRAFGLPQVLKNYPESYLAMGFVSEEDMPVYRESVNAMRDGTEYTEFVAKIKTLQTGCVWMKLRFTGIKDEAGRPVRAVCTAEVITEYKELEERFQAILAQNQIESWIYDIPRRTLVLTQGQQSARQYQGKTEIGDVPETHIRDHFCYPDDADKLRALYQKVNRGDRQVSATVRFWDSARNEYRWKLCSYTTIFDRDNTPLYAVGSAMDISEQENAQRRYEAAVEYRKHTQPENMLISGHSNITQDRILDMSDGLGVQLMHRFSDRRNAFLTGIGTMIVDEAQRREFYRLFLNEGARHNFEIGNSQVSMECGIAMGCSAKEFRWVQVQLTVVQEPATRELECFIILVDQSKAKRQEQILKTALQLDYDFVASLNLSADVMYIYRRSQEDIDFTRIQGTDFGDSYRRRYESACNSVVVCQERDAYRKCMAPEYILSQLAAGNAYEFTYHIQTVQGEKRAKRARFAAYHDNHALAVFSQTDVTEILAEQERQKAVLSESLQTAEKANKAKSDFLSRISHDMRTPLNGMLGLANLMRDSITDQKVLSDLSQLELSGQYLLNLINDTLDVSRIESGNLELHPAVCDGTSIFNSVQVLAKPTVEAKHLQVKITTSGLTYPLLYIDIGRVEQIMLNVVGNAAKFTPEGGMIECTMTTLSIQDGVITDEVKIRDNGIGISSEFLPHIFEAFSQEDSSKKNSRQGTGLGMIITKQLVELMGGTISVESELGKGTCVTFTLVMPIATPEQIAAYQAPKKAGENTKTLAGKRVLLCEDHPLNAQIAGRLLEKKGIALQHAENGQIGLETFAASPEGYFDAILMDIRMPVMDGLEATEKIRALNRTDAKTVPIIAMTANALVDDIAACKAAGMNAHLAKPIEPQLMYETIAQYIKEA